MRARFAALGLLLAVGCGTIHQARMGQGPAVYGGVRYHVANSFESWKYGTPLWGILDFPFSLVADTVLLPVSIINEIARGGIDVRGEGVPSGEEPSQDEKPMGDRAPADGGHEHA